jgi:ubiquinone/menaquinone biosynthesis C-methylase UbiE
MADRYLTSEQARRVYDRIGRVQDLQAFYEHRAIEELLAHADFEDARAVFELGYGTGAFAQRVIDGFLPAASRYVGIDVSPKMQALARRRLGSRLVRADLRLGDGSLHLPFEAGTFDRFVATYVFDLLSDADIEFVLREAERVLTPDGRLCLASLTCGETPASRLVTRLWQAVWSHQPELVGGCRPLRLADRLDPDAWTIRHRAVVTTVAVSSEVLVAALAGGHSPGSDGARRFIMPLGRSSLTRGTTGSGAFPQHWHRPKLLFPDTTSSTPQLGASRADRGGDPALDELAAEHVCSPPLPAIISHESLHGIGAGAQ